MEHVRNLRDGLRCSALPSECLLTPTGTESANEVPCLRLRVWLYAIILIMRASMTSWSKAVPETRLYYCIKSES